VSAEPPESADEPGWTGPLPEAVRLRVVALASEALGALPDDEVSAALRRFRRWAPARRTKLAATPLPPPSSTTRSSVSGWRPGEGGLAGAG
jgi:hypothetical protein